VRHLRHLRRMTTRLATFLFALAFAVPLGCGVDDDPAASAATQGSSVRGRIVFADGDGPIDTVKARGGKPRQLAGPGHEGPRWSHASTRISMSTELMDGRVSTALVDPDGSDLLTEQIPDPTLSLVCAAWSPNDARLACEGWDDARPERKAGIFTIAASGWDHLRRVTANPNGGHDLATDYSPDGTALAFIREDPTRNARAGFVIGLDGHGLRRVSPWVEEMSPPRWSPDGRWLLFDTAKGYANLVHPDGTGSHRIHVDIAAPEKSRQFQPGWSPDGKRIVFCMLTSPGTTPDVEGIYTAKTDGSDVRPVIKTATSFFHAPDWGLPRH
jgi:Tol biopolymer transport system component